MVHVNSMPPLVSISGKEKQKSPEAKMSEQVSLVEVYCGEEKRFAWEDDQGFNDLAGYTHISVVDKGRPNQDSMAVAKGLDGSVWQIVADGLGESEHSDLASEIVSQITAQKLAEGRNFQEAVEYAAEILKTVRYELAARIVYNLMVKTMQKISNFSAVRNIPSLDNEIDEIVTFLEEEFELIEALELKQFIVKFLQGNLGKPFDFEKFWNEVNDYIQVFEGRIFQREPATTVVAVGTWQEDGNTIIKFHNVGDSGAALLRKEKNGNYSVVHKTRPQSMVQEMYEEGVFHDHLPEDLSAFERETLAESLKRNHSYSNLILSAVDYRGIHGYEAKQFTFYEESPNIKLEKNNEYILLIFSDGLSDNAPIEEYANLLSSEQAASDILESLVNYRDQKYFRGQDIWDKFYQYYEELKKLQSQSDKIQDKMDQLIEDDDEKNEKIYNELHLEQKQIDERFLEIDGWIKGSMIEGPAVSFSGSLFPSYLAVDGSHADDTTVMVRVIKT